MDEHDPRGRGMKREKDKATKMFYTNVLLSGFLFQLKRDRDRYVLKEYHTFNHPVLVGKKKKNIPPNILQIGVTPELVPQDSFSPVEVLS